MMDQVGPAWSQTQTFHLGADPRYQPTMTDAEGAAQLKMALEVGGWVKSLYDNLAKIRDVTVQLAVAHSPDDELIPIAMGAALAEAAQAPAEWIEGAGGHNGPGVLVQAGTRERVARFMRALVGG